VGVSAQAVRTDIQYKHKIEALAKVFDRFGTVEFVANDGGVAIRNAIPDIKEDDWNFVMRVKLKDTFLVRQAFFKHTCDNKDSHNINVASRAGKVGPAKFGGYEASKFRAHDFMQVADAEGQPFNVKATCILRRAVSTRQRAESHADDDVVLLQKENITECVAFVATRPDRIHITEASLASQFAKPIKMPTNLQGNV
jgi:3-oxoacyl-[acyl-carrier protein] reductase